ncbi:MAG TPA: hypothetical protein VG122_09620 [Gemmata sp.]|nr:hypothetical protein [Gemmata sp.]
MDISDFKIFCIGKELGYELLVFVHKDTYDGDIEDSGAHLNNELGHQALDGDFCVEDNDGTLISYRIPDLAGTANTFVLGDNTFDLARGHCFVLTPDYQAEQLPVKSKDEALKILTSR